MDLFSRELDDRAAPDDSELSGEMLEPTFSVSELGNSIQGALREAFASVWVAGELQRLSARPNGHRYFELVEKGDGDQIVGKLDAVIWKGDFARIAPVLARSGQALVEGVAIRCRVVVDFYPPFGRLQLHVKEIDPVFSLGELARRRAETLRALEAAGLLDLQRQLPIAELPLRIALVTSHGSAAYHDFMATLRESGYAFRVVFVHSAVQGLDAERSVASALRAIAALEVDCVALVRGGGSKSDLAAFDSREIATAVARCPVPVLTGLGHEIDESVADRAAHQAFKTPTKVAEFLVARLDGAALAIERASERLVRAARLPLASARERLAHAERRALRASTRVQGAGVRLEALAAAFARSGRRAVDRASFRRAELARRLARELPRALAAGARERNALSERIALAARGRLATAAARLDGLGRLVVGLSPERTLARGFSITRRASGELVRTPGELALGDTIRTTLATGELVSRVENG